MSLFLLERKLRTALAKFLHLRRVLPTKYAYSRLKICLEAEICILIEILIKTTKSTWEILTQSGKSQSDMKFFSMPQYWHFIQMHWCCTIPIATSLCKILVFQCLLKKWCEIYLFTQDCCWMASLAPSGHGTVILVLCFYHL